LPKSTAPRSSPKDCINCEHRSLRMFCNLDEVALEHYSSIGVAKDFAVGDTIFEEGTPGDSVYVLCTGQVKLFCASRDGKTLILKIAMPGDVLGLGAIISGSSYEVTAETLRPTHVKRIHRNEFLNFLEKNGEGSMHAAKALSDDYKNAFFDARRLALSGSAAGRLAGLLLDWGRAAESCGKMEMRFTMALSQGEIANMIGSSRETVSRLLARFTRENLIQVRGSSVHIVAPRVLKSLVV
jgi:CRP/FNR family cyclic AMP-dependent transcriptional regulator